MLPLASLFLAVRPGATSSVLVPNYMVFLPFNIFYILLGGGRSIENHFSWVIGPHFRLNGCPDLAQEIVRLLNHPVRAAQPKHNGSSTASAGCLIEGIPPNVQPIGTWYQTDPSVIPQRTSLKQKNCWTAQDISGILCSHTVFALSGPLWCAVVFFLRAEVQKQTDKLYLYGRI